MAYIVHYHSNQALQASSTGEHGMEHEQGESTMWIFFVHKLYRMLPRIRPHIREGTK